ncbi:MAG: response regulator [Muricauda sp.]|nr:response regulator [Allomuricauda sp.]MAU26387.1 response regulator [Allomuricauda sp.]MBC29531.1 response regulator [Allomuricauda sp.]
MQTTIFIIDDDLVSQFATRYCIEQYDGDFNIVACGSAEEGLKRCANLLAEKEPLPDIIFLDLVMGDMNGWAFIDNLELISEGHKQPDIYVLSAFVNSKDRAIAKEHSLIAGYFDKPLTKASLEKIFAAKTTR